MISVLKSLAAMCRKIHGIIQQTFLEYLLHGLCVALLGNAGMSEAPTQAKILLMQKEMDALRVVWIKLLESFKGIRG